MSPRAAKFMAPYLMGGLSMLLAVIAWQGLATPRVAHAQLPDAAAQRLTMIRELQQANKKLDVIADLLKEIRDADKDGDKDKDPKRPAPRKRPDRHQP